jgi:glutathione S-transferase
MLADSDHPPIMSNQYTLYYFNSPGRAEAGRLLFAWRGIEFKDVRQSGMEEHNKNKEKGLFPFGSVPFLQDGDFGLAQSIAIVYHLSKKFNMWPSNSDDDAKALSILLAIDDARARGHPIFMAKTDEEKAQGIAKLVEWVSTWQNYVAKLLEKGTTFFPEIGVTGVDIAMFDVFYNYILKYKPDFQVHPAIKKLIDHVASNHNIAKWIADHNK